MSLLPAKAADSAVPATSEGMLAALAHGRELLMEARDDFERMYVHDRAKAIAAAAEALKLADVQTVASILVQDCRRAIAIANPAMTMREAGALKGKKLSDDSDSFLTSRAKSEMRSEHDGIDDDEYAEIKAEAAAKQQPVTASALKKKARANRAEAIKAEAPPPADPEPVAEGRLVVADYREFLAEFDGEADLILTDPPYAISRESGFASGGDEDMYGRYATDFGEWDQAEIDLGELAAGCYRALRKGGTVIVFYDLWKTTRLADALTGAGFRMLRLIEWSKTNPMPINPGAFYLNTARELAVAAVKGSNPTFNAYNHRGRYEYPAPKHEHHPTQKPDGLFAALVEVHSAPGDLVLDPFAGGGTTAVAATTLGRRFAAADLNSVYVGRAQARLTAIQPQLQEAT